VLQRFGYDADELSSDLSQKQREKIMARVRQGELRFLVATDVAARGIDLPELSHVIIFEPPENPELYIHRAGRTGRAGGGGVAISLVDVLEQMELDRIATRYSIEMEEWPLPGDEDVEAIVSQRATALLEARLRDQDRITLERMERFEPLVQDLVESKEGQTLLAMLVDEYYQKALHPAPERPEEAEPEKKSNKPRRRGRRRWR
jgi:ATP-dependent RNA helicase DeaD